jgi:hypothetical protein
LPEPPELLEPPDEPDPLWLPPLDELEPPRLPPDELESRLLLDEPEPLWLLPLDEEEPPRLPLDELESRSPLELRPSPLELLPESRPPWDACPPSRPISAICSRSWLTASPPFRPASRASRESNSCAVPFS